MSDPDFYITYSAKDPQKNLCSWRIALALLNPTQRVFLIFLPKELRISN